MKPRTRTQIEKDIELHKKYVAALVDNSIQQEERSSKSLQEAEGYMKQLRAEPCYEDTLEGRIKRAEEEVFKDIMASLSELSTVTGKNYIELFELAIKGRVIPG